MAQPVIVPSFVDHYPTFSPSGYLVTNEEPKIFDELLGKATIDKFDKAASIVSGGEILLSIVAPRAKKTVGVDHSYYSMAVTYGKILQLQEKGVRQFARELRKGINPPTQDVITSIISQLPEPLKKHDEAIRYGLQGSTIAREWAELSKLNVFRALRRLGRITFLHGDLADLLTFFGPVDLLYVSNATEHLNRGLVKPTFATFAPLLNPGGLLLYTHDTYTYKTPADTEPFTILRSVKGARTCWMHCLAQKKEV